jgi:ABC-type transporter Mla subunit MlaD
MFTINVNHYVHFVDPVVPAGMGQRILSAVGELKEIIIMNDAQLQAKLAEIQGQTTKVFGEVSGALAALNTTIADLQAQLANAGNTSPEVDALVTSLADQVGALDALIPDAAP